MQNEAKEKIEIKRVSEREYCMGENRWYLGEDNIIYITLVGEMDEKMAIIIKEVNIKFLNMVKEKVNVLIYLNRTGKASPEVRKVYNELNDHEKAGKIALFGLHPVARVLASFVTGLSKNKNQRFFKTKDDALAWLKE